jgi:hypothetical protein
LTNDVKTDRGILMILERDAHACGVRRTVLPQSVKKAIYRPFQTVSVGSTPVSTASRLGEAVFWLFT